MAGRTGKKSNWKDHEKEEMAPLETDAFVVQLIQTLKSVDKNTKAKGPKKRGRPRVCTDAQIANAIIASGGFMSRAAEMLNVHYQTIYKRVHTSPDLQYLVQHINEKLLDYGELELLKAMKRGESWAICFYLKCKGKDRGYVEKQTVITTKDDNSVSIVIE